MFPGALTKGASRKCRFSNFETSFWNQSTSVAGCTLYS